MFGKGFFDMKYDYIVVGTGVYGATFARCAAEAGCLVKVLDKRPHVGGNAYTQDVDGICVHRYGAHIFHTQNRRVWEWVNRFASFNNYVHSVIADYKGERYSLPFNMHTFYAMWGVTKPIEAKAIIEGQRKDAGINIVRNLEQHAISLVGTDIYEKLVKGYTEKQWGRPCDTLSASIIKRLPVRFTYNTAYFDAAYQGIPIDGYTKMIQRMLDHPNIDVTLNTDYRTLTTDVDDTCKVIYTGPIDEYFDYKYGALEYRSLRFETETLDCDNFQGCSVVNYTDSDTPYTRIIEHRHFDTKCTSPKTVITKEYSKSWQPGSEPYYPINDEQNNALYEKYRELADENPDVIFGGRLGLYRYMDMDAAILHALELADRLLRRAAPLVPHTSNLCQTATLT